MTVFIRKGQGSYYIPHNPNVARPNGWSKDRAIISLYLENWAIRIIEQFFSFFRPCKHRAYHKGRNRTELLSLMRGSLLNSAWKGGKHG